ncbi:MAG: 2-amino-4-hydroxy-6-hydroxymethyldihydropteridine diphosphokinase [Treponema sp.]|nr:2-amino-4-hydroxy-6-hydroxymethyldihydropteridine diphosphokinase [Treponema sp.]
MKVYTALGLGSNREYEGLSCPSLLGRAVKELSSYMEEVQISSVYLSRAMYLENQADFYNMVLTGFFDGKPEELLSKINGTEALLGRDRSREVRNGCRSMDIDIELFGLQKISTPCLQIPHPRFCERAFVLKPLLEVFEKNADINSNQGCLGTDVSGGRQLLYGAEFIKTLLQKKELKEQEIRKIIGHDEFLKKYL